MNEEEAQRLTLTLAGLVAILFVLLVASSVSGFVVTRLRDFYDHLCERLDAVRWHSRESHAAAAKALASQESCRQLLEALAIDAGVLIRPEVIVPPARSHPRTPGLDDLADEGYSLVSSEWEVME